MSELHGSATSAAQLVMDIMKMTDGYSTEDIKRAFQATLVLRGEPTTIAAAPPVRLLQLTGGDVGEYSDIKIGPKARKWIQKNGISRAQLDEIFHLTGDNVEVTASEVLGTGKKEMTVNCYLLAGVRGLLQFDEPKLNESETLDLCKRLTAYDKNNHTTFRKAVGNRITGIKPDFILTGPGEKAAAELIKLMAGV